MADLQQLCDQLRRHGEHGDSAKVTFYYVSTASPALLHSVIYVVRGITAYLEHAHLPVADAIADIVRLRFVKVASLPLGDVPVPEEDEAIDLSALLVALGMPPIERAAVAPTHADPIIVEPAPTPASPPISLPVPASARDDSLHPPAPDPPDVSQPTQPVDEPLTRSSIMAKISLEPLRSLDGYVASALVDTESGMLLAGDGTAVNLEVAAAGNAEVVRAKRKVANSLKLNDTIEDILISLTKQYHIIRPLESNQKLFLYVVLDRSRSNLAMARHELRTFEKSLDFS